MLNLNSGRFDYNEGITNMQCLPDSLKRKKYYIPTNHCNEKNIKEVLKNIEKFKNEHTN